MTLHIIFKAFEFLEQSAVADKKGGQGQGKALIVSNQIQFYKQPRMAGKGMFLFETFLRLARVRSTIKIYYSYVF